jgi:hypothetical protein
VHGQLEGDLVDVWPVERLEADGKPTVQLRFRNDRDRVVERLPVESVDEPKSRHGPSIGQCKRRAGDEQQLPADHLSARQLGLHHVGFERGRNDRHRELVAGDARGHDNASFIVAETVELPLDHVRDRSGNLAGETTDIGTERDRTVAHPDRPGAFELVHQRHHEERIPLAAPVDERGEAVRERVPGESGPEVLRRCCLGQGGQRELHGVAVQRELGSDRLERVPARQDVLGAIRADHQEPCGLPPACEHCDEIQRRTVAPMQVLDDQDQRSRRGHGFQRFGHFAQHALGCGTDELPRELLALGIAEQRGQLREPSRREPAQHANHLFAALVATQAANRVEDRQVRLGGAAVFEALTTGDPTRMLIPSPIEPPIDERRFPDACFTGDEDDLPRTRACRGERLIQPVQRILAAEHRRDGRCCGSVAGPCERADEPVPAPMCRLIVFASRAIPPHHQSTVVPKTSNARVRTSEPRAMSAGLAQLGLPVPEQAYELTAAEGPPMLSRC